MREIRPTGVTLSAFIICRRSDEQSARLTYAFPEEKTYALLSF